MDLFGKRRLEERVAELEEELAQCRQESSQLASSLERKEARLRRLASDYQEVNQALKKAEQQLEQKTTQAVQEQPPNAAEASIASWPLRPREVARLGERLREQHSPREDLISAWTREGEELPPDSARILSSLKSDTGFLVYHYPTLFTIALIPPFPIQEESVQTASAFATQGIVDMLETSVLLVSAHAGDTFIGVSLSSEGFEAAESVHSVVKEKHSKGGWSQRRFERLREEDIRSHMEEVQGRLDIMLGRFRPLIKYAVLSGDRSLIKGISVGDLPVLERRLERHDTRRQGEFLEDLYRFTLYRG
ncbi:MAG: hypothetical protein JW986_02760 [Methanotrichaceae archaeon]|nr:hypothetical protein [Methanotrichaceae archaeon]